MYRSTPRLCLLITLILALIGCCATHKPVPPTQTPAIDQTSNEKTLPKVLIIGDSISMAYHQTVVAQLEGIADVSRIPMNGQYTGTGVKKIDDWLGDTNWDVIHFNWGLWDLYGWEFAAQDRSPQAYAKRLEELVIRLKKTNAHLIWATTTPACPEPEVTMRKRFATDAVISEALEQQYLDAAQRVMKKHKVRLNDLHALIKPDMATYAVGRDNVHYNGAGNRVLGRRVSRVIRATLQDAGLIQGSQE